MFLKGTLFIITGFITTKLIQPKLFGMLNDSNCMKVNYKNERIPISAGLIFIPIVTLLFFLSLFLVTADQYISSMLFLLGTLAMGFVGFIDDMLGNRNVSGIKGHFRAFFRGNLTTGMFKALYGGFTSLVISFMLSSALFDVFINTIIIALFTNTINLLDLRPGRAAKGYIMFSIVLLISPSLENIRLFVYGLTGSVAAYIPYDLKAKSMMGDVGSNILGISLGILCATNSSSIRIIALIFLVLFHIYTEKYSLTDTIEGNQFLKYIDRIGR